MRCTGSRGAAHELRSIQVVQNFNHAHLIQIHRVWCAAEYLVVAMELADGSLADLAEMYTTEVGTPLPPQDMLAFMAQAASALDILNNSEHLVHGQRVTIQHCDVTPRNILLVGNCIKISDFGLTSTLTSQQKVHYRAGTPGFAAPEVLQGRVSNRTDQYALAVCYCALRGGRLPFPNVPMDFRSNYARPDPDLTMLSPAERPAVARALATMPRARWSSCGELVAELEKVACGPRSPLK